MSIGRFFLRWFFVIWFFIAALTFFFSQGKSFDEGGLFGLSVVTFPLYFPIVAVWELSWFIEKSANVEPYVIGALFALSIDLLRMHIKKYREYKRIALQMKK